MEAIFLTIESFLYLLNLLIIMSKIMEYKNKNYIYIAFAIVMYVYLFFTALFRQDIFIYVYMSAQIVLIILIRFLYKKSKIITVFGIYLFIYCVTLVLTAFLECILLLSREQSFVAEFIVHCIVFIVCVIFCYNDAIGFRIKNILKILSKKIKLLLVSYMLVNTILLIFILTCIPLIEVVFLNISLQIAVALLSLFLFIIFPIMIITIVSNSYLKSQNERFQKDIEAQAKHYLDLAKANYELRRFKHDFGNMKIGLSQSLKEGDCAGALDMLNSAAIDMQRSSEDIVGFDTGNGIVDAILADKQSRAKINNTKIVFSGSVPLNSIAPTDLCIIFGNTLDNAIEACGKFFDDTEKIIFVTCRCNSGFVFIDITNRVAENVSIHGTNVETSKPDKASHGYGLYSLNKTVKKLDGEVKLSCENKIFKVEIDFSIEQNIIYA